MTRSLTIIPILAIALGAVVIALLRSGSEGAASTNPSPNPVPMSSAAVQQALTDGQVTEEEYVQGVHAVIGCLRASGYAVQGPTGDPRERLTYTVGPLEERRDVEPGRAVEAACRAEHLLALEEVWFSRPQVAQSNVAAGDAAVRCLQAHGWQLSPDEAVFKEQILRLMREDQDTWSLCLADSPSAGIRPPSP